MFHYSVGVAPSHKMGLRCKRSI